MNSSTSLFRNKVTQGDFLLSLPGSKPFLITVARLTRAIDWKLNIVVNSPEEKEKYISQFGIGPEQVLLSKHVEIIVTLSEQCNKSYSDAMSIIAQDFSPLAQEIWRCISPFCRFMVSDIPREVAPDPLPFTRGANFVSADLKALRTSPKSAAELLKSSLQILKTYQDVFKGGSDDSVKVVDIAEAVSGRQRE